MEFDEAIKQSRRALAKLRDTEARILADPDLTPDAKNRRIADANAHYRGDIAAIRLMAETALDSAAADAERALQAAHAADLAKRRQLLGDATLADIARRTVEHLSSPELVAHWRSQATEYEAELVGQYGRIELQRRMRDEPSELSHWRAAQELAHGANDAVVQAQAAQQNVEAQRTRLGELDPLATAQATTQRTGVPLAHAIGAVLEE